MSLALFDVDDFRSANERDGRDVGDDILRQVAAVLAESVRLVDTVGRIGGDEFVLVAPGSAGAMVARRVLDGHRGIAGRRRAGRLGFGRRGAVPGDGSDSESLIAAATEALTRARGGAPGWSPRARPSPKPEMRTWLAVLVAAAAVVAGLLASPCTFSSARDPSPATRRGLAVEPSTG